MIDVVLRYNEEDVRVVKVYLLNPLVDDAEIVHFMDFSEGDRSCAKYFLPHLCKKRSQVYDAGT